MLCLLFCLLWRGCFGPVCAISGLTMQACLDKPATHFALKPDPHVQS